MKWRETIPGIIVVIVVYGIMIGGLVYASHKFLGWP